MRDLESLRDLPQKADLNFVKCMSIPTVLIEPFRHLEKYPYDKTAHPVLSEAFQCTWISSCLNLSLLTCHAAVPSIDHLIC